MSQNRCGPFAPSTAAASRMSVGSVLRPASRMSAISGVHSQASIAIKVASAR